MKIELTIEEADFIAKALKAYAVELMEYGATRKPAIDLTQAEKTGRKICARFFDEMPGEGVEAMSLEESFNQAREAFCGIGNDSDL